MFLIRGDFLVFVTALIKGRIFSTYIAKLLIAKIIPIFSLSCESPLSIWLLKAEIISEIPKDLAITDINSHD